ERKHGDGRLEFIHFGSADGATIFLEMSGIFKPFTVGHRPGSVKARPFLKVVRELGVLHTHKYGRSRFLRCIIPVRMRSFTVPSGWPSASAISVWLIPWKYAISRGIL